jgi:hypothetical protein
MVIMKNSKMKINDLSCVLNMPPALSQRFNTNGQETACSLPRYNQCTAFVVDEYPACPQNWMRSSGDISSYFVPVLAEHGLWLDFNSNGNHTHHIAIVISVQGINAITGQKTEKLRLEQYRKKCPVHKKDFGHERFCEECGFKWPKQNYLASNVTPSGLFWLDGFRAQDGEVRQYVFTEDVVRGVAAQILGEERVFAIGIAFYLSKEPKPKVSYSFEYKDFSHTDMFSLHDGPYSFRLGTKGFGDGHYSSNYAISNLTNSFSSNLDCFSSTIGENSVESSEPIETTKLEIAAGAKINQQIYPDVEKLNFWQTQPAGIVYINYLSTEDANKIIEAGKIDMTAKGEGFMNSLRVGK